MRKAITVFTLLISCFCIGHGQGFSDSAEIYFRQGKSGLELDIKNNRKELDSLLRHVRLNSDCHNAIKSIHVTGGASPEGSVAINEQLSRKRAEVLFNKLSGEISLPDSITSFTFIGRDWAGLKELVSQDDNVPYRNDVISLIDTILSSEATLHHDSAENLLKLKRLRGGAPYQYMYTRQFPALRASKMYIEYYRHLLEMPQGDDLLEIPSLSVNLPGEVTVSPDIKMPVDARRNFYMALKTNMLYDLLAVPNISAEFYVGKNWSIVGNWMYGWWKTDARHRYWRIYGGDVALRWWFGSQAHRKPLTGHHIGVYGGVVTYDFEWGGKGYMGGLPGKTLWDRCMKVCGLEYGYSLPIARRLNIDFTIGIGYMGGKYMTYEPDDKFYVWKSTNKLNWFGPTKAEISLVWLIGNGNYNSGKKGGMR